MADQLPDFPREVLASMVHHSETIEWRRLIRPGERLEIEGRVADLTAGRSGTRITAQYQAFDAEGRLVFTEWTAALFRGVGLKEEGGRGLDAPRPPEPPESASAVWNIPILADSLLPWRYDIAADIHFPIHTSPAFAKAVGLPGVIVQGTATLALAARELVDREAGGDPERLDRLSARFTGMVFPGDALNMVLDGRRGPDRWFHVADPSGRDVLSRGYARIRE
jgi:acyl dehydratase